MVTLEGNVRPLTRGAIGLGALDAGAELDKMVLVLEASKAQQAELDVLVEAQQDAGSPLFHQWLTPAEFGARFGAGAADVSRVTEWLTGRGFAVDEITASNRLIVFSGTAGQVEETLHTGIRRYKVDGVEHIANSENPQIPAEFAGVVSGVVSLHDFRRTSEIASRRAMIPPAIEDEPAHSMFARTAIVARRVNALPEYTSGSTHYLFPADFAVIYDLNALYVARTTGAGTSIAIVGRSNINVSDVTAFRAVSGLAANNPTVITPGTDPGLVGGDQDEATLDVEWSGAVAPGAAVKLVAEASTATTDGVDLSAAYVVNHATAPVVSLSYGSCEREMGATELAFYNSLWEQAASQGMSVFVAAGDSGAAGCNSGSDAVGAEAGVNGLCSSPYSICVGGTEFADVSNPAEYWGPTNAIGNGSALRYIPEEVWNESAENGGSGLWASGGGTSTVYAEPAWQKGVIGTGVSGAALGMRAVPDVALSAADHDGYMVYENGSYWIFAGTSVASPSFAGVMALVVEKQGGQGQGNANARLYALADGADSPFRATLSGNNSVPGVTGFTASGAVYNLATGLGSVDGAELVSLWRGESGIVKRAPMPGPVRHKCAACGWR
jgi:subtilase family serine protease